MPTPNDRDLEANLGYPINRERSISNGILLSCFGTLSIIAVEALYPPLAIVPTALASSAASFTAHNAAKLSSSQNNQKHRNYALMAGIFTTVAAAATASTSLMRQNPAIVIFSGFCTVIGASLCAYHTSCYMQPSNNEPESQLPPSERQGAHLQAIPEITITKAQSSNNEPEPQADHVRRTTPKEITITEMCARLRNAPREPHNLSRNI